MSDWEPQTIDDLDPGLAYRERVATAFKAIEEAADLPGSLTDAGYHHAWRILDTIAAQRRELGIEES